MNRIINTVKAMKSQFTQGSVKESLDNLPTGICVFSKSGVLILCNRRMYALVFDLFGKDLQSLPELQNALAEPEKSGSVTLDGEIYLFPNGSAWYFSESEIVDREGESYTQITASEVTDLYEKKWKLAQENEQLRKVRNSLRQLSKNVVAETREKELLSMKVRVHDEVGSSMIAAHQLLREEKPMIDADVVVSIWERAIGLLKRTNDEPEARDELTLLRELCAGMGIEIIISGEMPGQDDILYLLITALRECATNAVRYGRAKKLFLALNEENGCVTGVITNDGKAPSGEIVEGGGLSMLRRRIEHAGGRMAIKSVPVFELTVTLPVEGREFQI